MVLKLERGRATLAPFFPTCEFAQISLLGILMSVVVPVTYGQSSALRLTEQCDSILLNVNCPGSQLPW